MRTLFLLAFVHACLFSFAQDRCGSVEYVETIKAADPSVANAMAAAESFLQKRSSASGISSRTVAPTIIQIPVVVHVIYKNASDNISDEQIKGQIDALNRDFRRKNSDTANTPERFRHLAADIQIEFYLAKTDPLGRATSGITRKQTNTTNWHNNDKMKFASQGGSDAWDGKSYLNIWVCRMISGAGYSSVPGSDPSKDGVVINVGAFGANGSGNYSMGRTTTHEVGHWLGLRHIWGDAACGDDGIADTPQQSAYTQNCPTGFRTSCNNGETGDMYMNYMDYTADACMNLFTLGQKAKMRAAFDVGGPRESLLQSKGLKEPSVQALPLPDVTNAAAVYPNPAQNELNLNLGVSFIGKTIFVVNMNGIIVQTVQVRTAVQKLNLSHLKSGMYFLKAEGLSEKFIKL